MRITSTSVVITHRKVPRCDQEMVILGRVFYEEANLIIYDLISIFDLVAFFL